MLDTQVEPAYAYAASDCPCLRCASDLVIVGYAWRYQRSLAVVPMTTLLTLFGPFYGLMISSLWLSGVWWLTHAQYQLLLFYAQSDDGVLMSLDQDGLRLLGEADVLKARRNQLLVQLAEASRHDERLCNAWKAHVTLEHSLAQQQRQCIARLKVRLGC